MNCYNHPETAAVGMCKNCSKGVCTDCVGTSKGDLICKRCEDRFLDSDRILDSAKRPHTVPAKSYVRPVFMTLFGLIYIVAFGLKQHKDYVSVAIGVLFVGYGSYLFVQAFRFNRGGSDDLLDD